MRDKDPINVKRNATLNFQIGLIASLLFIYLVIEMYTKKSPSFSKTPVEQVLQEKVPAINKFQTEKQKKKNRFKKKLAKV